MRVGQEAYEKLQELGKFSESGEGVTRYYLSKEYHESREFIENYMRESGLTTRVDVLGNIIGEYRREGNKKTLMFGSHMDSVKNGGKYDGNLGIILPISCVRKILSEKKEIDVNIVIAGFAYEEGVTYPGACFTSRAVAGCFDKNMLDLVYEGKRLYDNLKENNLNPDDVDSCKLENIDGYLEVHIEQGPVLENKNLPLGIVTAIQACYRYVVRIGGEAGHSGTIPMDMRRDAVVAMSEIIYKSTKLSLEDKNYLITFGKIDVFPGAINVIPEGVEFTIDIRAIDREIIKDKMVEFEKLVQEICSEKNMSYSIEQVNQIEETKCSERIVKRLEESFIRKGKEIYLMPSGAGHDAQEMENLTEIGMLFVRCIDGISHSPKEEVRVEDLEGASEIVIDFIENFHRD